MSDDLNYSSTLNKGITIKIIRNTWELLTSSSLIYHDNCCGGSEGGESHTTLRISPTKYESSMLLNIGFSVGSAETKDNLY